MMNLAYLILLVILLTLAIASLSLAPWVPTRKKDLKRICELAKLKPGETFYDLGCGDGRLVMYAGSEYDIKSIGIELAWLFYLICSIRRLFVRHKNIDFKFKSLFYEDLSGADVVYLFAQSEKKLSGRIIAKLEKELKPGARVITYVFPIRQWQPAVVSKPTENDLAVYLYIK